MKSKLEIIEETVNYYSKDTSRRATTKDWFCDYLTEDGRTCAIGRVLIEPKSYNGDVYSLNISKDLETIIKEEYRGHNIGFWADLQRLHDKDNYWDKEGIRSYGIEYKNKLMKKYKD